MTRFLTIALRRRLAAAGPPWVMEPAVALGCVLLSVVLRLIVDRIAPGALALGIVYPCCLLATLLIGWRAGAMALVIAGSLAWYFVLTPGHRGFHVPDFKTGASLILFFITAMSIVLLADQAVSEQDRALGERELLIEEINHRTKNNFQLVISLLELQARKSQAPAVVEALKTAVGRIAGLARSHRNLYTPGGAEEHIALDGYLAELCQNLSEVSSLGGAIRIERDLKPYSVPRDRAVAVGIILNEAVTNCLKHAFKDRAEGLIRVTLAPLDGGGAVVRIEDDGVGFAAKPGKGGMGSGLIDAFARQAGGAIERAARDGGGAAVVVTLSP
jgi:two-component sensor histidine kinase